MKFDLNILKIEPAKEMEKLSQFVMDMIRSVFRRKGVVVGISGSTDSDCMVAIAVHAMGKDNVIGLILPEKESNPVSCDFSRKHAEFLEIEYREINISPTVVSEMPYALK